MCFLPRGRIGTAGNKDIVFSLLLSVSLARSLSDSLSPLLPYAAIPNPEPSTLNFVMRIMVEGIL